jgi:hypothetical protein
MELISLHTVANVYNIYDTISMVRDGEKPCSSGARTTDGHNLRRLPNACNDSGSGLARVLDVPLSEDGGTARRGGT